MVSRVPTNEMEDIQQAQRGVVRGGEAGRLPSKCGLRRSTDEMEAKQQACRGVVRGGEVGWATTGNTNSRLERGLRRTTEELEAKLRARQSGGVEGKQRSQPLVPVEVGLQQAHQSGGAVSTKMNNEDCDKSGKPLPSRLRFLSKNAVLWATPVGESTVNLCTDRSEFPALHPVNPIQGQSSLEQQYQQPTPVEVQPGAIHVPSPGVDAVDIPTTNILPSTPEGPSVIQSHQQLVGMNQFTNISLAVASMVREPSQLELGHAQEVDPDELERRAVKEAKERQCRRIGYILIFVALAIIVSTVLGARSSNSPVVIPSMAPSAAPTTSVSSQIRDRIDSLFESQKVTLTDGSAQSKAYDWLLNDQRNPNILNYTDGRILQRYALATLYYATSGENWTFQEKWMSSASECDWRYRSELGLSNESIYQHIKNPCQATANTTRTDPEIYRHLWLDSNDLYGSIPVEIFLYLPHLETLSMSNNAIKESEFQIWKEENPQEDEWYYLLSKPEEPLGFQGPFPSELGLLANLEILRLAYNGNNGTLPTEIGALTSLKEMSLAGNSLTSQIPSELGMMTSLERLDLEFNSLSGQILSELGLLTSMVILNLHNDSFTGQILSELGSMTSLVDLSLTFNSLTGPIPSELALMTSLVRLYLNSNSLTGQIPSELGLMTSLESLYLSNNSLTGPIPSELGLMTSLELLVLHNNSITGQIPSEIGLMTSLEKLFLYSNTLTDQIPSELGLMTSLVDLSLLINYLTGQIPT